ncbi:MAG: ribbon-helix-helix domain-containing protein [Candidatus Bathyarchaeia archaeon]
MGNEGNRYITIKLPIEIVSEIDSFKGHLGFRSRCEFVKEAVRQMLYKYKTMGEKVSN